MKTSPYVFSMKELKDFLKLITVRDLKDYLSVLKSKSKATRKAEIVDAVYAELSGEKLIHHFNLIDDLDKKAVIEAIYSDSLCFDEAKLIAKYGEVPLLHNMDTVGRFGLPRVSDMRLLKVFFYIDPKTYTQVVPLDIARALRAVTSRPEALTVPTLQETPNEKDLIIEEMEHQTIQLIPALLRLGEQGKLKISPKTGKVTDAVSKLVLRELQASDFYPEYIAFPNGAYDQTIGYIKPIGWLRMLDVAGAISVTGSKSQLTPAGMKLLRKKSVDVVCTIWKKWLANSKFDEFNRIDEIDGQYRKGHMTAKPPRRKMIVEALKQCPVEEWIGLEAFSRYMRGSGQEFTVSREQYNLYIADSKYGHFGYSDYGGWDLVEKRYLMALLFEYAAPLGLIDIAYVPPKGALPDYKGQWGAEELGWLSRYDGLRAFRINKLGAYSFGMTESYTPSKCTNEIEVKVSSDLTIEITSGALAPLQRLLLETWAKQKQDNQWVLEGAKCRTAVERGQNIEELIEFLEEGLAGALCEEVDSFLAECERDAKALQPHGQMRLFSCRDRNTCTQIVTHEVLSKYCMSCGGRQLVVYAEKVDAFLRGVRALGLGVTG